MRPTRFCIVGAFLLAGCAAPSATLDQVSAPTSSAAPYTAAIASAEDVGGDCPKETVFEALPLPMRLKEVLAWATVSGPLPAGEAGSRSAVFLPPEALQYVVGPKAPQVETSADTLARLAAETSNGVRLTIGIGAEGVVRVAVPDRLDGTAPFIGKCQYALGTEPLAALGERAFPGRSAAEVLDLIIHDPGPTLDKLDVAGRPAPLPTWEQLSPWDRQVDPASTPKAVLAGLLFAPYALQVPKDWIGTPVTLCSHSSIGWDGCSTLNRAFQTDPAVDHMTVHYVKGEDVTLWVVGEYADFRGPRQQIGVIPADVLLAHRDNEIELVTTSDRPDGAGLAAHLKDGTGTRDWVAVRK